MIAILIGPPGAGKGTQAEWLKKSFNHISTGNLFRKALKDKSPLGEQAKLYIDKGELVPDGLTVELIKETLSGLKEESILFDGFPRNRFQAEALEDILQKRNLKVDKAIFLKVTPSVVVKRLSGRRYAPESGLVYHIETSPPKVPGRCDKSGETLLTRSDDTEKVILSRLEIFNKETVPLWDFYKNLGVAKEICAEGSPSQVFQSISEVLKSIEIKPIKAKGGQ